MPCLTHLTSARGVYWVTERQPKCSPRCSAKLLPPVDTATAWLRTGELDAALVAVEPVLDLPTGLRTEYISQRLTFVRAELARQRYYGSPQAREVDGRIEDFTHEAVTTGLDSIPAGPS